MREVLIVMAAKFAALVISLGSGTSGGLLAPTFLWSAAMGGLFAIIGNHLFPAANLSPGAFALVAMGAVFGAASRATFSFIIFAFEITRDYNAVLPLMLVAVIADGIAMLFMPNSSIMCAKATASRGRTGNMCSRPSRSSRRSAAATATCTCWRNGCTACMRRTLSPKA